MSCNDHVRIPRRQALGMLGALALSPAVRAADPYPTKPIRYILPFSPGTSTDFISRLVCDQAGKQLGQPFVIENKPGAGGVIGSQQLARATPDGYTIGLASLATLAMAPATMKEMPYDAVRDFDPLSALISTDLFMVAGPRAQGKTLGEFVTWARQRKEPVFLGTLGAGTSGHFAGFLFGQSAKITFEPIHYRSFADLLPAMLTGAVDVMMVAPNLLQGHTKEGQLRGLAMNGPARVPAYPDVPTFAEAGYPDMQFMNWIGMVAPAKVPAAILDKLHAEIVKAINLPAIRTKVEDAGFRVLASSREEFATMIRKDVVLWRDMVKATGFKV